MSGGLLGLLGGIGVGIVALAVVTAATDVATAAARAQTAADAAALAAAGASPLAGGDGNQRGAADAAAAANGAVLAACCAPPDEPWSVLRVEVVTTVAPRAGLVQAVLPAVSVRAAAALRPPPDGGAVLLAGDGRFVSPAAGPITSGFGWRTHPISGTRRFHAGVDIGAPAGTPVRAATAGTVVAAGWRGGYGLTVVIDHNDGTTTLYAHLSSVGVRPGQHVAAGQQVGAVGSTGMSTGPHLHFEVRVRGEPVDPINWLSPATRRRP